MKQSEKNPEIKQGFKSIDQPTLEQKDILQTLIDISAIITTAHNLEETLYQTVELIAERMRVDVCSLYLKREGKDILDLKATHGLNPQAINKVSMSSKEGLIGLVLEQESPINACEISNHPRFKYFPDANEDSLSSFLGVPLIEFRKPLGVLSLQNKESRLFSADEEKLIVTIGTQISGLISKALLVDRIQKEAKVTHRKTKSKGAFRLEGIPIAPGLANERVVLLARHRIEEPEYNTVNSPETELGTLYQAVNESIEEILELIRDVNARMGAQSAAIFHAHLLFLEDRAFIQKIQEHIEKGASASWAVSQVVREHLTAFRNIDDPYLQERGADLEDVGFRLLNHLGFSQPDRFKLDKPGILLAEMLTPSDTAKLDPAFVKGIITTYGGHVSHAAILARSLRIPAVTGVGNAFDVLPEGEKVLLDGDRGIILIRPTKKNLTQFKEQQVSREAYLSHLDTLKDEPCVTKDGVRINLFANVGLPTDMKESLSYGAEGVGLYRTENFYLISSTKPTVDDLKIQYKNTVSQAEGKIVTFRTLDLGGDKFPTYLNFPKEENPFLGLRSIRFQLRRQELLKDQLTAIISVADQGNVRLMFPMISHLEELHQVKRIYRDVREEYAAETGKTPPEIPLGMMFEVPSAVLLCDLFAGEIDFMAIGSNDLTQYILAVDRNNPYVSALYDPLDPAVLLMIKRLIDTAKSHNKPIELCGEMSSDPEGSLVLIGLGLREMSMNPPLIPLVKDRLRGYTIEQMEQLARIALTSTTAESVRRNIQMFLH